MTNGPAIAPLPEFLSGGGEMGKLIGALDWSATPLGPIDAWPQSLRTTVSLCLASNFPISIAWGPGHVQIYNDGYWPICAAKHPHSMGQDFCECWASAWPAIGEAFARGLAGEASYIENRRMFLDRNGFLEETFFTFSFSPIRDETGGVAGLFHPVTEQTARMLSERRVRALRDLAASAGDAKATPEVFTLAARSLGEYDLDLPFLLIYRLDAAEPRATLVAQAGLSPGTSLSPGVIDLDAADPAWPIAQAAQARAALQLDGLAPRFAGIPCGPYPEPVDKAIVLPIAAPGTDRTIAVVVAGVSTRLPLDSLYRGFYDLLATSVAAAVANARAYEDERRRAEVLAELDHAKTTFFSNVSHEFRTPLALTLGPLEDALADASDALSDTQRERISIALRNTLRLLKLVNTLLDFSRIEANRARAVFEPLDLAATTAELASNFHSACERGNLRLLVHCPPLPHPVFVDRDMWEKIVLNLISNAFKFTFDGEIAVSLHAVAGDRVQLEVRDTGIGIPTRDLPHVFERFHRVEGARGRSHEGSGIGLALVHDLTGLLGGEVSVESELDRGSSFRVTIPMRDRPVDASAAATSLPSTATRASSFVEEALRWLPGSAATVAPTIMAAGPARPKPPVAGGDTPILPRVLFADDNADMRAYVSRVFLDAGFEISAVKDGETALAALHSLPPPDLVLVDVMMPGQDGIELTRAIRRDPALRGLPIVIISARAGEEASIEGLEAGADDYLVKPFSARELVARVRSNLDMARLRNANAEHERRQRHQAEQAREELLLQAKTLEEQVEAEVAERRKAEAGLFQMQKMEAIGQLTGGMAHDFNNLLGVIIGNIDALRELPKDDPSAEDYLDEVVEAATKGAELTQGLLAFARRQPLQPQRVGLNDLIARIVRLLSRLLGEKITIPLQLAGDLWTVLVDPAQFEASLANLATNARDAMPHGGQLTISTTNTLLDASFAVTHVEVQPGDYAMIEISDTGSGMPPEVIARIFEPFYTTKEPGKGTGLGLSMVYGFIKQSNGHIDVDSEPGKGTTIRLYLPRIMAEPAAAMRGTARSPHRGAGETVLAVEDNTAMRRVVVHQLSSLGYRVLEADGADAALDMLAHQRVDVLLTDVVMPGSLDGIALARHAAQRWPELKVILMSGFPEMRLNGDFGATAASVRLLNKPYRAPELARLLREVLER